NAYVGAGVLRPCQAGYREEQHAKKRPDAERSMPTTQPVPMAGRAGMAAGVLTGPAAPGKPKKNAAHRQQPQPRCGQLAVQASYVAKQQSAVEAVQPTAQWQYAARAVYP